MVYKVYYQELPNEVPVRERTDSMYVEAEIEREVREKLADKNVNIEYIEGLSEEHLQYEQQDEDFKMESF
ncbi:MULTISPECIES: DNA-dependent RNA polymerase subunit epsilon [Salimicrobium]|uniref:DNA-directed RNA polymerase subunit epsilon n=2 Tax=Salimicrobium TaxID=351195 RepID=A0ABY1KLN9_9BACI|nr:MULTISPECIES: RNA polymerase epsilon subunit [Salimicrobium]SDX35435.1 DNA-dependent RNA polymerase auxiliary subunit epsilon [Salimicrobium album]SIS47786.1 DNA-dependent RNA polymerase auxiliary subunit epsilon [Salimicrobium salexigens]